MDKSILETVHETAKGLKRAGVLDTQTMREFDLLCRPPSTPIKPGKSSRYAK